MTFIEMLRNRWQKTNSMACVGLDSDFDEIPNFLKSKLYLVGHPARVQKIMRNFNLNIISATHPYSCAYKLNLAFYEEQWTGGLEVLQDTVYDIRTLFPGIPIILDTKWADIGNSNKRYAKIAFDLLGVDAVTVNPYFGGEALEPFLERTDKGIIIICRTSNKGAKDFQDIGGAMRPLYQWVAHKAANEWNKNGNCLLVVGATYPNELREVRKIVRDMPILVPAIGEQKGDLKGAVKAGLDSSGFGMIISSSREVIFASKGEDFAEAAGREAKKLRDQINEVKTGIMVEKGGSP